MNCEREVLTCIAGRGYTPDVAKIGEVQITFRAPPDLTEAIDREVERLAAEQPGQKITRSDVVRSILYRTLLPTPAPPSKEAKEPKERPPGKTKPR